MRTSDRQDLLCVHRRLAKANGSNERRQATLTHLRMAVCEARREQGFVQGLGSRAGVGRLDEKGEDRYRNVSIETRE